MYKDPKKDDSRLCKIKNVFLITVSHWRNDMLQRVFMSFVFQPNSLIFNSCPNFLYVRMFVCL